MSRLTIFYIVRHAESTFNVSENKEKIKYKGGEISAQLSENGKSQAQKLAKDLKDIEFLAVFASDLLRARETAEIVALERKIAVETNHLLRERAVWEYLRQSGYEKMEDLRKQLKKDLSKLTEKQKMQYKHSPRMESAEEGAVRLLTFIKEVAVAYQGKNILAVSHGNVMRSLLNHLGWAKYDELPLGSIDNTGYIVLESDGVDFFIKEMVGIRKIEGEIRDF